MQSPWSLQRLCLCTLTVCFLRNNFVSHNFKPEITDASSILLCLSATLLTLTLTSCMNGHLGRGQVRAAPGNWRWAWPGSHYCHGPRHASPACQYPTQNIHAARHSSHRSRELCPVFSCHAANQLGEHFLHFWPWSGDSQNKNTLQTSFSVLITTKFKLNWRLHSIKTPITPL